MMKFKRANLGVEGIDPAGLPGGGEKQGWTENGSMFEVGRVAASCGERD